MISLLCPTRNRRYELTRMVNSAFHTRTGKIEIVCYVDDDDDSYSSDLDVQYVRGPRITLSDCWNRCAENAKGEILMMCGDDMMFCTPGWDAMIEREFAMCIDKILMVYGNDCTGRENDSKVIGVFPTVHRKWVDTVGYFAPPYFVGDFADTWLNDVALALNRRKYLPYVTEHLHFLWNKSPLDDTYRERLAREAKENPDKLYLSLAGKRQEDIEKLRKVMNVY